MAMTNRGNRKHDCFIFSTLEELVPQDHEVRKLEDAIDWMFIYPLVKETSVRLSPVADLYKQHGRRDNKSVSSLLSSPSVSHTPCHTHPATHTHTPCHTHPATHTHTHTHTHPPTHPPTLPSPSLYCPLFPAAQ